MLHRFNLRFLPLDYWRVHLRLPCGGFLKAVALTVNRYRYMIRTQMTNVRMCILRAAPAL